MISIQRLKKLRANNGWSQEQLAAISGVSSRTIQRIEKTGECSLESKMALCSAFGIEPMLLNEEQEEIIVDAQSYKSNVISLLILSSLLAGLLYTTNNLNQRLHINGVVMAGFFMAMSQRTQGFKRLINCFMVALGFKPQAKLTNIRQIIRDLHQQIIFVYASAIFAFVFHAFQMSNVIAAPLSSARFGEMMFNSAVSSLLYAILIAEFILRSAKMRMDAKLTEHFSLKLSN